MPEPTDPQEQYERWLYPDPHIGLDQRIAWNSPGLYAPVYWPSGGPAGPLNILVAGCGTTEAAVMAQANPGAHVVGIDVSAASLAHQARVAADAGIDNLELIRLPIEQAPALERRFHFVSASGVIHHLADPSAGLAALGRVLEPDGVIVAAIYARHGRTGVYMLQEFFRRLGLGQSTEDVALVRSTLNRLPPHHPLATWTAMTGETGQFDSHVVDTWLHSRDQAYTVDETLALVRSAGLELQGWFLNAPYHPDAVFPPGHPTGVALDRLHGAALWSAMELISARNEHLFICRRPDTPRRRWAIDFTDPRFSEWVPHRRFPPAQPNLLLPYEPRDPRQEELWRGVDGERSVREIVDQSGLQGEADDVDAFVRWFFQHLWRKDNVVFRLPGA